MSIANLPWAKLMYSAVLMAIIVILLVEVRRLWWDHRVYVGRFQVFAGSEEKKAQAATFSVQLLHYHRTLVRLFAEEEERRAKTQKPSEHSVADPQQQESTWWPRDVAAISNPHGALGDLELSVQGVNVKDILSKLRNWVSAPNEISGVVDIGDGNVSATVTWPKGPSKQRGALVDTETFTIEPQRDASGAAFQVACGLVWAQAASQQKQLAGVDRIEFCRWTQAWMRYLDLREQSAGIEGLTEPDIKKLKELRAFLDRSAAQSRPYPEVFRLRADVIDLLPTSEKTPEDIEQAQKDRTQYTILVDPEKRNQPRKEAFQIVLAEGRPAIPVTDGELRKASLSPTWQAVLAPYQANVVTASRATGYGFFVPKGSDDRFYFCGFAVKPNLIITTGFSIRYSENTKYPLRPADDDEAWFFFGDDARDLKEPTGAARIEEIVYASNGFALLRIADHDVMKYPPLKLDLALSADDALLGRYVFVVGYPARDTRKPREYLEALLGNEDKIKRVMPGRILSVNRKDGSRTITSDVSTSAGTSGGPLVDLVTGRVMAIHHGSLYLVGTYAPTIQDILTSKETPGGVKSLLGAPKPNE